MRSGYSTSESSSFPFFSDVSSISKQQENISLLEQIFQQKDFKPIIGIKIDNNSIINDINSRIIFVMGRDYPSFYEQIWLDLLKMANSSFALTVMLYALLEQNDEGGLTRAYSIAYGLGLHSVETPIEKMVENAKSKLRGSLMDYFDGNENLFSMLTKPILDGVRRSRPFTMDPMYKPYRSNAYDVPLHCFNLYDEKMKQSSLENRNKPLPSPLPLSPR